MKRGFTLVETLLAFGLLLVTAIFVFQMLPASVLATRQAEVRVEAQRILSDTLESYRARNFDGLTQGSQTLAPVAGQLGVTFQPTVTVAKLEDADPDRALEVKVDITWTFRSRECHLQGGTALWRVQH